MAWFASLNVAPYVDGILDEAKWLATGSKSNGDNRLVPPDVWITLAEDALRAGRKDQAEELIEQAYRAYDEAMANVATSGLGPRKKEAQLDAEQVGEPE